jgi:hypothetical protein
LRRRLIVVHSWASGTSVVVRRGREGEGEAVWEEAVEVEVDVAEGEVKDAEAEAADEDGDERAGGGAREVERMSALVHCREQYEGRKMRRRRERRRSCG